jgi:glutamate-1-semialdehyde 2,1-aminomutase
MLEAGVWLPPSQFEAAFVSMAHGVGEVEMVIGAAKKTLAG